tara:strand:- start:11966 stop:12634 length:669 start_codon:yes stop_codon:yes gene_type:complete
MKNSLLQEYILIFKLTLNNYSPLRILQILKIRQLIIDGKTLDLGSDNVPNNPTNYLLEKNEIFYASKFPKQKKTIQIDLENHPNKVVDKFDNIFLINVLEHIKNVNNCLFNINDLLKQGGKLFGSTPFIFYIHASPNDYLRYTKQFLEETLKDNNFTDIKVENLGTGIFCCIYTLTFNVLSKIPFLNILMFPTVLFLDKIVNLFTKNYPNTIPIGYFFSAKK